MNAINNLKEEELYADHLVNAEVREESSDKHHPEQKHHDGQEKEHYNSEQNHPVTKREEAGANVIPLHQK
ncbi:hypothetical protein AKO1_013963 [Acrasis kona]|uniref:Uncharacterized protein n=1 Tax=Acrasis kona TaxID=1008807 RepID=A0AAW2YLT6_9EUKA